MAIDFSEFYEDEEDDGYAPDKFVRKNPAIVCGLYSTGLCCNDRHFDPSEVLPNHEGALCKDAKGTTGMTTDRDAVNCKECIELLHS